MVHEDKAQCRNRARVVSGALELVKPIPHRADQFPLAWPIVQ